MVSVDGEEPGNSMYIQVPEKELEEQEEEPKQDKKLTRRRAGTKKYLAEAVARYNEQHNDPDYYYLPDKLDGKKGKMGKYRQTLPECF